MSRAIYPFRLIKVKISEKELTDKAVKSGEDQRKVFKLNREISGKKYI